MIRREVWPAIRAASAMGAMSCPSRTISDATRAASKACAGETETCAAASAAVGGTVVVHGTKSVTGFLTGDPYEPIVPTSFKPATFDLTLALTDFSVVSSTSTST